MNVSASWSVPANVLIAGEYAITLEGGGGLAVAVEPRAYARVERLTEPLADQSYEVTMLTAGAPEAVRRGHGNPLVNACFDTVAAYAPRARDRAPSHRIEIDTSAFYDQASGSKRGLGSSAAAAVLMVSAFLYISGIDPVADTDRVLRLALKAHRLAHGGRGSGYDVATSLMGGWIAFTGGTRPAAHALRSKLIQEDQLQVWGWNHGKPVQSAGAVACFERLLASESGYQSAFVGENNATIEDIQKATTWSAFFAAIDRAKRNGEQLGRDIGVPACVEFSANHPSDGWIAKASGAGNERAVALSQARPRRRLPARAQLMAVDTDGLRREEWFPS